MKKTGISKAVTAPGQIDGDYNRNVEGAGLGLSLVSSQLDAHGGVLIISSAPGNGATFAVRFPAERTVAPRPAGVEAPHAVE